MNPNDATKILFPPTVEHIIIDIGAANSDYLAAVEQRNDPTVALILVDPVPASLVPLIERVAKFNLLDPGNYTLLNRVFALQGAMAETEQSHVNFQMSLSNHCGLLLKANENNNFWCWDTASELVVTVFRLEHLLDMIPNSTVGIKSINIKIDAEGADLLVLKGGGKALERDELNVEARIWSLTMQLRVLVVRVCAMTMKLLNICARIVISVVISLKIKVACPTFSFGMVIQAVLLSLIS